MAGTGIRGFSEGGLQARKTDLNGPSALWLDGEDLYIADTGNHRVLRVEPSGEMVRVAGNEEGGYSGEGGPATGARLNAPSGLCMDNSGNLYVVDTGNHRVRRIDPSGTIVTVAGNGEDGGSGDGGPATEASLSYPERVAVDGAGNLYISDSGNRRVRRVDSSGTITTFLGIEEGGTGMEPAGLFVDAEGGLTVVDRENHRVLRAGPDGEITVVAGQGMGGGTEAGLHRPSDIFPDGLGNLYVADTGNHRVWRVDVSGRVEAVAGGGVGDGGMAHEGLLINPFGVTADGSGNLYIADTSNQRVRKVDVSGRITTVAGSGRYGFSDGGGQVTEARLADPVGICVDGSGNLYIADTFNHRVRRVDLSGRIVTVAGTEVKGYSGDGSPATEARLANPVGVFVDGMGALMVADQGNHRIRRVGPAGGITTVAGTGERGYSGDGGSATEARLAEPSGVYVDGEGALYIADRSNYRIRKVDRTGAIHTVAGEGRSGFSGDGGPATRARLRVPLAVWGGPFGNLYIADRGNSRIRRVDASGVITTVAGDGGRGYSGDGTPAVGARLARPFGFHVDGSGRLIIADTENHRIRQSTPPQRTIRAVKDVETIAADGSDEAVIEAEVRLLEGTDLDDDVQVVFQILEGEGTLSDVQTGLPGGRATTRLTSRSPGRVSVGTSVVGAWSVTASVEVTPVARLHFLADPGVISANGFDASVLQVEFLDLEGNLLRGESSAPVRFRIVEGEGELSEEKVRLTDGRAETRLKSLTSSRVRVEARAEAAEAANVLVAVKRPTPGQLPDAFEPDDRFADAGEIVADGEGQTRTIHTRGKVDWISFEARRGYVYTVAATGELEIQMEVYSSTGQVLGHFDGRGEIRSEPGALYVGLSGKASLTGQYELSVRSGRDAVLSVEASQDRIAADGSDGLTIEVQILGFDGALQSWDHATRVVFEVMEGEGVLADEAATVQGGGGEHGVDEPWDGICDGAGPG